MNFSEFMQGVQNTLANGLDNLFTDSTERGTKISGTSTEVQPSQSSYI
jgi:hypothetical protein